MDNETRETKIKELLLLILLAALKQQKILVFRFFLNIRIFLCVRKLLQNMEEFPIPGVGPFVCL